MLKLFIVAAVIAVVAADLDTEWTVFKTVHNKKYDLQQDLVRKSIWMDNKNYIEQHNKLYSQGRSTFYLGENEFADMKNDEFAAKMNGVKVNAKTGPRPLYSEAPRDLPATVDWRTKGYVTPIKSQGQCQSGWAFSANGALEGQHFKSTGKLVNLSASNLVDCTGPYGNSGCIIGFTYKAFNYIIANKGVDTEISYPYHPKNGTCRFNASSVGANLTDYQFLPQDCEPALQKAVAEVGPISVTIDASHRNFQLYSGGIYRQERNRYSPINHSVLAIGYGTDNGVDYWLVKNSWGTTWGMEGYIKMIRNYDNNCGISTAALYPIV